MSDEPDDTQVNPTVRMSPPPGYSAPESEPSPPDTADEKHSALVGYMSVPVHRLLPIRRSTLLMIILFLGFGTLCYLYPPASTATVITCKSDGTCTASTGTFSGVPATTTTTTTTTVPPITTTTITTTTSPPATTTTTPTRTTSPTTSTTAASATTTTRASGTGAPTTTVPTTTTTSPGVSATSTTATP
jgi:hypothetical protein